MECCSWKQGSQLLEDTKELAAYKTYKFRHYPRFSVITATQTGGTRHFAGIKPPKWHADRSPLARRTRSACARVLEDCKRWRIDKKIMPSAGGLENPDGRSVKDAGL